MADRDEVICEQGYNIINYPACSATGSRKYDDVLIAVSCGSTTSPVCVHLHAQATGRVKLLIIIYRVYLYYVVVRDVF